MATTPEAKIDIASADAAAEKAYAQAAAAVEAKAAPKAEPKTVTAAAPAPIAAPAAAPAAAKPKAAPVAKQVAVKKAAAQPVATKKPVAAKKITKKATAKPAAKKIAKKAAAKPAAKLPSISKLKDTIMTKTKATTEDFTAKIKDVVADAQGRAKTAFNKTSAFASDYGDFTKGNVEALVESGKILAAGLQDMGKSYVAEGKSAVETMTADVKELAAVKSPTDFFKLQGELLRRNFDAAVAATSKNSEAAVKLAGDVFAPISTRVSLAVEKVKKAA